MSQSHTIVAGKSFTNGDGVTVDNKSKEEGGKGEATMTPKGGNGASQTMVKTKGNFAGEIKGLDGNDSVSVGSSSTATVSGAGGTVSVSGGSTVSVQNTGPAGGPSMTVTFVGGASATIPPGSSVTFKT